MSHAQGTVELEYTHERRVAWITINNPSKHNAISVAMWERLDEVVDSLGDEARCVVLRGGGDQAFVSGADISEFIDRRRAPEDVAAYDAAADQAMGRLSELELPTLAMISGYCFGGGVALAMCCDIRIAAETAVFAIPAARLGLGYPWRGIEKLLRAVSVPVATDILISGRRLDAKEALNAGLVNQLHGPEDLYSCVAEYAATVSTNAPLTVRAAKTIIRELASRRPADLERCEHLVAQCFASRDYVEGTQAFMEKRAPRFVGR